MVETPTGSPGLLRQWIERRFGEYVEPTRLGVPRGEAVGLSRKKYLGALLALTHDAVADQAARIGVAYHVLGNWRSEPAFRATVEDLAARYVGLVRDVVAHAQAHDAPSRGRFVWPDGSPIFVDAPAYGPPLREALHHLLDAETDEDVRVVLARIVLDAPLGRPLWCHAALTLAGLAREHLSFAKGRSAARARAIHALELQEEALANLWTDAVEDARDRRAATPAVALRAVTPRAEPLIVVPLHAVESGS